MSCQFGMLNFTCGKVLALGGCQGDASVAWVWWAFRGICLLCLLKTYGLCLLTVMLSLWRLYCNLAGLVNLHVRSERVGHVGSTRWGSACATAAGLAGGRLVPGIARHGSVVRATRLNYPKSEGKGYEVTHSVKQVEYKEE